MTALLLVVLSFGTAQAAPIHGDLKSNNNDLSYMITQAHPITGTCAPLHVPPEAGEDGNDTLREYVRAEVYFADGVYPEGWYRGYLQGGKIGEFYFYKVIEVTPDGERRQVTRAGRCGNQARNTETEVKYPKPCEPQIVYMPAPPSPPPPPPPCPPPPPPPPPPIIKVECPPCPACPAPVINMTCPTPERVILQPRFGAQLVHTSIAGADLTIGWFGRAHRPTRYCPPYPDVPIPDPSVRPAPSY